MNENKTKSNQQNGKNSAVTIQTPIAELKSTLTGKYGEDTKLIYDLVRYFYLPSETQLFY